MDVFARVCEALREDDLGRLRTYIAEENHRATFSTWLVAVVRNLTIDWFRHRDGRPHLSVIAARLPPFRRRIFELVYVERRQHVEAYEMMCSSGDCPVFSSVSRRGAHDARCGDCARSRLSNRAPNGT
jgi:hypothetical protein